MGGPNKGKFRDTSVSNAILTTQSILTDAVAKGVEEGLKTFATLTLPMIAPQIFAAYVAYERLKDVIKALKEYKELSKRMPAEEAALKEAERIAARETAKALASKVSDAMIENTTYTLTAGLLARPELKEITGNDERVKYMLLATLSQFIIGIITGGRNSLIDNASRLIR